MSTFGNGNHEVADSRTRKTHPDAPEQTEAAEGDGRSEDVQEEKNVEERKRSRETRPTARELVENPEGKKL